MKRVKADAAEAELLSCLLSSLKFKSEDREVQFFYLKMHQKLPGGRAPSVPAAGACNALPHQT